MSTPIIEEYVIAKDLDRQPMKLVGIDLLSASAFNNSSGVDFMREVDLNTFMVQPNMVLISKDLADHYNLGINDTFYIDFAGRSHQLVISQLVTATSKTGSAFDDLLITDIATAQEILEKIGWIDRIDLIIPDLHSKSHVIEQIENILPMDVRLEHKSEKIGSMREMVSAYCFTCCLSNKQKLFHARKILLHATAVLKQQANKRITFHRASPTLG